MSRRPRDLRWWADGLVSVAVLAAAGSILYYVWAKPQQPATAAARPALPTKPLSIAGDQVKGHPTAKIAVVVFSDYECPYCGMFAKQTLPELEKKYIKSGDVLLAFKNLPLQELHPNAFQAAVVGEC